MHQGPKDALYRFFKQAEREIALLFRASPQNLQAEKVRLASAWARGVYCEPAFSYPKAPFRREVTKLLAEVVQKTPIGQSALLDLARGRALELWREARLVEALCRPEFRLHSRARFQHQDVELRVLAERLARDWVKLEEKAQGVDAVDKHVSDDTSNPLSLASHLLREIGMRRLPARLCFDRELSSLASVGEEVVKVRPGALLTASDGRRIALHEIEGHLVPRINGKRHGLSWMEAGTAHCSEHEEGRAVLLEERAGLFDAKRKQVLGARYLAAEWMWQGMGFVEVVRGLTSVGLGQKAALDTGCRVFRGGGLGREGVYLPAYLEVKRAFAADPSLESSLRQGRLSLEAARTLPMAALKLC